MSAPLLRLAASQGGPGGVESVSLGVPLLLVIVASVLALVGLLMFLIGVGQIRRKRWGTGPVFSTLGVALLAVGALGWVALLGTRGYRALTKEEVAATIRTQELGPHEFRAVMERPQGRTDTFRIAGDQLYVDAHILKWHPWANVLGLHTAYELSRVGGRYRRIADERSERRTVYPLEAEKPVDMFRVAETLGFLEPLVDAVYGSAAFIPAREGSSYELRVSTSGLLFRELEE